MNQLNALLGGPGGNITGCEIDHAGDFKAFISPEGITKRMLQGVSEQSACSLLMAGRLLLQQQQPLHRQGLCCDRDCRHPSLQ